MSKLTKFHQPMVMLDLETLDTNPNAVVYEVGLVVFECNTLPNPNVEERGLYFWRLHTRDQKRRSISASTVKWMQKTDQRANEYLDALAHGDDVDYWADNFCQLDVWKREPLVWAQGTDFDFPILESLLHHAGRKPPWRYNHKMDLRTLHLIARKLGFPQDSYVVPHSALEDAMLQARRLGRVLSYLNVGGTDNSRDRSTEAMSDSPESLSVDGEDMSEEGGEA